MTARLGFVVRAFAMALATLVLAHTLIFVVGYGAAYGAAMAHTGHDHGWTVAVAAALVLGGTVLATAAWRWRHLRRVAADAGAPSSADPGLAPFLRRWLAWWLALALATAILFVAQENLELHRVGAPLPGIGVLASAVYPWAAVIIAAVALAVSLLAALLGWQIELLIARIRAVPTPGRRPVLRHGALSEVDRHLGSVLGRRLAGRAPPV